MQPDAAPWPTFGLTPANFLNPDFGTDPAASRPGYAAAGAGGAVVGSPHQAEKRRGYAAERNFARCLEDKGYKITNRGSLWMRPKHWCTHLLMNHYPDMDERAWNDCQEWELKRAGRLGLPTD